MRNRFVVGSIVALTLAGAAQETRDAPAAAPSSASDSLPGRVVDVKAGEFYFIAPDTIPEGLTTFRLHHVGLVVDRLQSGATGRELVADKGDNTRGAHMLAVVRLDSGKTMKDLYTAAQARERTPSWAKQLGGPSFALPPRASNVTLDLEPGNYVLVCYIGSAHEDQTRYHFVNGMSRSLTVARAAKPHASLPKPDIIASIDGEGTVRLSRPIVAGRQVIRVENATNRDHEFKFQKAPAGQSGQEFFAKGTGAGPGIPFGGLASVPPQARVTTTIDFEPGAYILGTWPAIRHATSQVIVVAAQRR